MKDRILGAILAVIGLVSLASLGAIILFIPPETDPILVPALFSFSLFIFLVSVLTYAGTRLRRKHITERNRQRIFSIAFREGAILAFLVIGYTWLSRFNVLSVWTIVVPFVLALFVEYYFLTRRQRPQNS